MAAPYSIASMQRCRIRFEALLPINVKRLAVVIPSKSRPLQAGFLERAISSIIAQTARRELAMEVLVSIDNGESAPALPLQPGVRIIEAKSRGQAAALNAGAAHANADYLAFLEDDDHWHPERIAYALQALDKADFTSTTQLEVNESGVVARINDFPTPSGWVMPISTWRRVGEFDETFRWHLDSEWLGRLGQSGLSRVHLVEATAPVEPRLMGPVRPWLLNCVRFGGPRVSIGRHPLPTPLVIRLIHPNSGMAFIEQDQQAAGVSSAECQQLMDKYGCLPW